MAKTKSEPVKTPPAAPAAVTRKYASGKIVGVAQDVYTDIIRKNARPTMRFPIRSLSNVKYDPKNHEVSGYKSGIPFPEIDPKDPGAGFKDLWNFYYASPEGDALDGIWDFILVDGKKGVERRTSWKYYKIFNKGRLMDGVPPVGSDPSIAYKYFYIAVAPRDLKGTGTFTIAYNASGIASITPADATGFP